MISLPNFTPPQAIHAALLYFQMHTSWTEISIGQAFVDALLQVHSEKFEKCFYCAASNCRQSRAGKEWEGRGGFYTHPLELCCCSRPCCLLESPPGCRCPHWGSWWLWPDCPPGTDLVLKPCLNLCCQILTFGGTQVSSMIIKLGHLLNFQERFISALDGWSAFNPTKTWI